MASQLAAELTDPVSVIDQYVIMQLGNVISDEGLVVAQEEDISINDDHTSDQDIAYLYQEAERLDMQFGILLVWANDMLTTLYFAK